jgi:hypothetical protein
MKIFFASLTDPSIEVDAWVATKDEGVLLLRSLAEAHPMHSVIMRARLKKLHDLEERYIGASEECSSFLYRVKMMDPSRPLELP